MKGLLFRLLDPYAIEASASFALVRDFLERTRRTEIGWHYAIDLSWIHSVASAWPRDFRILDAGGGRGPTQFLLAEMGFNIVNIDLLHYAPSAGQQDRYAMRTTAVTRHDTDPYVRHLEQQAATRLRPDFFGRLRASGPWRALQRVLYRQRHEHWRRHASIVGPVGRIERVQADLCAMPHVDDASFDGVVSLSALEHIPLERLPLALAEIERVLKPDGRVAITTSASADDRTWYHAPSKGLCFSTADLEQLFGATPIEEEPPSVVLQHYRDCAFLRENLASFYHRSGQNGMPWGKWDPRYVPVGLWR